MLMKKLLGILLTICMLGASCAMGEESVFTSMQPLMDLTAAASLHMGGEPETITPEKPLSEAFVQSFLLLGQKILGMDESLLNDYLTRAFAAPLPQVQPVPPAEEGGAYVGVRIMAADESEDGQAMMILGDLYRAGRSLEGMSAEEYVNVEWLSQRAVVEMHRDEKAPGGWKLYAFSLEDELQMENAVQDYFTQTMVEYVNTAMGYAIQYPAVFSDDMVTAVPEGLSASLPDGTASFFVTCAENLQGLTLHTLAAQKQQETPAVQANINEVTGCLRLVTNMGDATCVDLYIVTEGTIYQAQLAYSNQLAADFALYSEYMMNSFTADELGIG